MLLNFEVFNSINGKIILALSYHKVLNK